MAKMIAWLHGYHTPGIARAAGSEGFRPPGDYNGRVGAAVNLRANSTFRAGSFARLEAALVPRLIKGAQAGADAVLAISQERVPVDTGYLKSTGGTSVEWVGHKVIGFVSYGAPYSAFVEFGIRQRGAAGEWAGPYSYSEGNGFAGFGYMRSSLDVGRSQVIAAFQEALAV